MRTTEIRTQIERAIEHERTSNAMYDHLTAEVRKRNLSLDDSTVREIVQGLTVYISNVPIFLDAGAAAAQQAGIFAQIEPFFVRAEQYFIEPVDLIPDSVGLAGLLDDAYLTMAFVSAASQQCAQRMGTPLFTFAPDLVNAHANVRGLLGDAIAQQIDMYVLNSAVELYQTMNLSAVQAALPFFTQSQSQPQYVDPFGGSMSQNDRINMMAELYSPG